MEGVKKHLGYGPDVRQKSFFCGLFIYFIFYFSIICKFNAAEWSKTYDFHERKKTLVLKEKFNGYPCKKITTYFAYFSISEHFAPFFLKKKEEKKLFWLRPGAYRFFDAFFKVRVTPPPQG